MTRTGLAKFVFVRRGPRDQTAHRNTELFAKKRQQMFTHTHTLIEGRKNPLHECQGKASKGKKKPATNPGSLPIHQKREEEGVPGDSVTLHLLPRGG